MKKKKNIDEKFTSARWNCRISALRNVGGRDAEVHCEISRRAISLGWSETRCFSWQRQWQSRREVLFRLSDVRKKETTANAYQTSQLGKLTSLHSLFSEMKFAATLFNLFLIYLLSRM